MRHRQTSINPYEAPGTSGGPSRQQILEGTIRGTFCGLVLGGILGALVGVLGQQSIELLFERGGISSSWTVFAASGFRTGSIVGFFLGGLSAVLAGQRRNLAAQIGIGMFWGAATGMLSRFSTLFDELTCFGAIGMAVGALFGLAMAAIERFFATVGRKKDKGNSDGNRSSPGG